MLDNIDKRAAAIVASLVFLFAIMLHHLATMPPSTKITLDSGRWECTQWRMQPVGMLMAKVCTQYTERAR